jgi:hypothetical protein
MYLAAVSMFKTARSRFGLGPVLWQFADARVAKVEDIAIRKLARSIVTGVVSLVLLESRSKLCEKGADRTVEEGNK